MEKFEGRKKSVLIGLIVGVLVLFLATIVINYILAKPSQNPEVSQSSQSSSSEKVDTDDGKLTVVRESDTPFTWTYEDYQSLTIGSVTMAEVETKFGSANMVYKEGEGSRTITYVESRDIKNEDDAPLQLVYLSFEKKEDDYYLTYKKVTNMAIPYEPVPKDQQVFTWTKETFDALSVPTQAELDTGMTYEEAVTTYGQPHRILTESAMSEQESYRQLTALYALEENESEPIRIFLDFRQDKDGQYRLWNKSAWGYED